MFPQRKPFRPRSRTVDFPCIGSLRPVCGPCPLAHGGAYALETFPSRAVLTALLAAVPGYATADDGSSRCRPSPMPGGFAPVSGGGRLLRADSVSASNVSAAVRPDAAHSNVSSRPLKSCSSPRRAVAASARPKPKRRRPPPRRAPAEHPTGHDGSGLGSGDRDPACAWPIRPIAGRPLWCPRVRSPVAASRPALPVLRSMPDCWLAVAGISRRGSADGRFRSCSPAAGSWPGSRRRSGRRASASLRPVPSIAGRPPDPDGQECGPGNAGRCSAGNRRGQQLRGQVRKLSADISGLNAKLDAEITRLRDSTTLTHTETLKRLQVTTQHTDPRSA